MGKTIAHFGTFDVPNYGDLLFPLILEKRLAHLADRFIHVSPRGGTAVWSDCVPSQGLEEFMRQPPRLDALVVGGGNIIHFSPTSLEAYQNIPFSGVFAYPGLWLNPAWLSATLNVPLWWNGSGVSQPVSPCLGPVAQWACSAADYLAVRDSMSQNWLYEAGVRAPVRVIPDTALEIAELWPADELRPVYELAFRERKRDVPAKTIVFHLNNRFLGEPLPAIAARLDRICQNFNATGILIALGPCHGDSELQKEIGGHMQTQPLIIDQPRGLREIAACCAHSNAYIGSSLHGLITACSYGRRCMAVVSDQSGTRHKFSGFLEQFQLGGWINLSWEVAETRAVDLFSSSTGHWQRVMEAARPLLQQHWSRVEQLLAENQNSPEHSQRRRQKNDSLMSLNQLLKQDFIEGGPLQLLVRETARQFVDLQERHRAAAGKASLLKHACEKAECSLKETEKQRRALETKLDTVRQEQQANESILKSRILDETRSSVRHKNELQSTREKLVRVEEKLRRAVEDKNLESRESQERIQEINSAWKNALMELGEIEENLKRKESELTETQKSNELRRQKSKSVYSALQHEAENLRKSLIDAETRFDRSNARAAELTERMERITAEHEAQQARSRFTAAENQKLLSTTDNELQRLKLERIWRERIHESLNAALGKEKPQADNSPVQGNEPRSSDACPQMTLLMVVHAGQGGTAQAVMDLAKAVSETHPCLLLKTSLSRWDLSLFNGGEANAVEEFNFKSEWRFDQPMGAERANTLKTISDKHAVNVVHVNHLIANGPELILFFHKLTIPVLFTFHDFYTVCPTIHLLDDQGVHCGGQCTPSPSDCRPTRHWFRNPIPRLKHEYVFVHREKMLEALSRCDALITTSEATRQILLKSFPALRDAPWFNIEHGRNITRRTLAQAPVPGRRCKVLCLGNLDGIKGTKLLNELLKLDRQRGPHFEFHFVGQQAQVFRPDQHGGVCHGRYDIEQLPELIESIRPSFSLIPSLWETYCQTLTECWAFGIPVIAAANGALKERVTRHGGGCLLENRDPEVWYEQMLRIANNPDAYKKLRANVDHIPLVTVSDMSREHLQVYQLVSRQAVLSKSLVKQIGALASDYRQLRSKSVQDRQKFSKALEKEKSFNFEVTKVLRQREEQLDYVKTVARIREAVERVVPPGARAAVISKGDDELIRMGSRQCVHFPADDNGHYLGYHPADGIEAVALLEKQHRQGVTYLVIPKMYFWWLRHYVEFGAHLKHNATGSWTNDDCQIYSLAKPSLADHTRSWIQHLGFIRTNGRFMDRNLRVESDNAPQGRPSATRPSKGLNKTSNVAYPELVKRVINAVDQLVPANSVVSVISKGDEQLLRFQNSRGWHFPQTSQGVYAGYHPASDQDAIDHLENQRDQGAQYLLIPATSKWWLDHYPELRAHLENRYHREHADDACIIFELGSNGGGGFWRQARSSLIGRLNRSRNANKRTVQPAQVVPPSNEPTAARFTPNERPLEGKLITVIVPVYNAFDDVRKCLESLIRHHRHAHQVLLIDDCSPDQRILPLLESFAEHHPHLRLLRNEENLGFTKTVNRGCQIAPGDVVLLNSDTEVTEGWLEKLDACARSSNKVGTVTAISNAAGAFSVPVNHSNNPVPAKLTVDDMGRIVDKISRRIRPSVPTGNGFCMYISRTLLNVIGYFDDEHFPRGYGEENDFCMRAKNKGFINIIDDATYIKHTVSASFGESKHALAAQSAETLNRLHPSYKAEVSQWLKNDPLDEFRVSLTSHLEPAPEPGPPARPDKPCLLYVIHRGEGGTPLTNADLIRGVATEHRCLLLVTGLDEWDLSEPTEGGFQPLRRYRFTTQWRFTEPLSTERIRVLEEIHRVYDVAMVHVRHLLGNGPELVDHFHAADIPVILSFHDYYTVCPTIQLIDPEGMFCEGRCTAGEQDCRLIPTWFRGEIPRLKHGYVHDHRKRMKGAIEKCDFLVTTCHAARAVIENSFPDMRTKQIQIIEHGRDIVRDSVAVPPAVNEPARIVCLGNIDRAKGSNTISRLMAINQRSGKPFEFHFLGQQAPDFKPADAGGTVHGRYHREDLPRLLREIRPSFSLIASICGETYCHTLTESWAMGIPVFASHFGALKERVEKHGGGWLIDPNDPDDCFRLMLEIASSPTHYLEALEAIRHMPARGTDAMVSDYRQLYFQCLNKR